MESISEIIFILLIGQHIWHISHDRVTGYVRLIIENNRIWGFFMYYGGGHIFGFGYLGIILGILLIIAFLLYLMIHRGCKCRSDVDPREVQGAMEVIKTRYAKGEINKEEFEEIKKTLLEK